MGKGICYISKHIQRNWPYPPPNTKFVVSPLSVSSQKNDITIGCSDFIIALICPTPLSNVTITKKFDSDVDIGDNSQYFSNPI